MFVLDGFPSIYIPYRYVREYTLIIGIFDAHEKKGQKEAEDLPQEKKYIWINI